MNNNPSSTHETTQFSSERKPGRPPITVNPERLERYARTLPTMLAVAGELEMSQATLSKKLLADPELRRAWERGRSAREEAKPSPLGRAKILRPAPEPESRQELRRPAPEFSEGAASERVLAALKRGGLTYGGLMHATGLDHRRAVVEVQRLMNERRVVATQVGNERRHFLVGGEVSRG